MFDPRRDSGRRDIFVEAFLEGDKLSCLRGYLNSSGVIGKPVYCISFHLGRNDEIRK